MNRFDFDVIGDTPAQKSRPPEPVTAPPQPAEKPVAEKPVAEQPTERRRDNAA